MPFPTAPFSIKRALQFPILSSPPPLPPHRPPTIDLRQFPFTSSQAMATQYRMNLNNFLQARFGSTQSLTWERQQVGPQHAGQWIVVAFFRGVEYGRGMAGYSAAAEEAAAYQVLLNLGAYRAVACS